MSSLFVQKSCNINLRSNDGLVSLHIAAHEGHTAVVEALVGYGADLNAADEEKGNTPLHLIIARKNMKPIDASMAYLWKVIEGLRSPSLLLALLFYSDRCKEN